MPAKRRKRATDRIGNREGEKRNERTSFSLWRLKRDFWSRSEIYVELYNSQLLPLKKRWRKPELFIRQTDVQALMLMANELALLLLLLSNSSCWDLCSFYLSRQWQEQLRKGQRNAQLTNLPTNPLDPIKNGFYSLEREDDDWRNKWSPCGFGPLSLSLRIRTTQAEKRD